MYVRNTTFVGCFPDLRMWHTAMLRSDVYVGVRWRIPPLMQAAELTRMMQLKTVLTFVARPAVLATTARCFLQTTMHF